MKSIDEKRLSKSAEQVNKNRNNHKNGSVWGGDIAFTNRCGVVDDIFYQVQSSQNYQHYVPAPYTQTIRHTREW